jgi:hypothetical protein
MEVIAGWPAVEAVAGLAGGGCDAVWARSDPAAAHNPRHEMTSFILNLLPKQNLLTRAAKNLSTL